MSRNGEHGVVRVLVVDDEPLVRKGIACVLHEWGVDVRVCEAGDVDTAVEAARSREPDLILLDSDLEGRRPVSVIPALDAAAPDAKIVVLALHGDARDVRDAFSAGADGYVAKEGGPLELSHALDEIERGARYLDPGLGASLAADNLPPARAGSLTRREQRVLELVAVGLTNREIARELGVSLRTIEGNRARAQRKRGLHSRADIVAFVHSR